MRAFFPRRAGTTALFVALVLSAPAAVRPQTHAVGRPAEPCLNFRPQPDLRSQPFDCIFPGTRVTVVASTERWHRVRLGDGREGWVIADYLVPLPGADEGQPPAAEKRAAPAGPGAHDSARARQQIARLAQALDTAERRLAATETERAELARRLERATAERDAAGSAERELRERLAAAEGERESAAGELAALTQRVGEVAAERDRLSRKLAALAAEVERLEGETHRMREAAAAGERETARRAAAAESAAARSSRDAERLERAAEASAARIGELEAANAELRALAERSRSRAARLEKELERTAAELASERTGSAPPRAVPAVPFAQRRPQAPGEERPLKPAAEAARPSPPVISADADAVAAATEGNAALEEAAAAAGEGTAAEEPAASIAPELPSPTEEARALVAAWASAWADQRIEDYLGFYSESFESTGGLDRAAWAQRRRERLASPGFIELMVAEPEVIAWGEDRMTLRFVQGYRSDSYEDRVIKDLELAREAEGWRIVRETATVLP